MHSAYTSPLVATKIKLLFIDAIRTLFDGEEGCDLNDNNVTLWQGTTMEDRL